MAGKVERYTQCLTPQGYVRGLVAARRYGDGWCDLSFMEIPVPDEFGPAFIFGEVFMREWCPAAPRAGWLFDEMWRVQGT